MTRPVLCVDVGSTFTKGTLVDAEDGTVLATAVHPTTVRVASRTGDVLTGVSAVQDAVQASAGVRTSDVLACSSAGGGLRIAVVGYEELVTAQAGHRVALTAGGRVVHRQAGRLTSVGLRSLRADRPDVILLVGGTDGGNAEVILHNAGRLAAARIGAPVVYAGNADAAAEAEGLLRERGRIVMLADNVLPRLGVLEPGSARAAIREIFLRHVIGGKGLSRGPRFARLLRAATPDAVLTGVELLAEGTAGVPGVGSVLVVDVGGATTDVYSALVRDSSSSLAAEPGGIGTDPPAERGAVVAELGCARTVEGDLGLRWGAPGVVEAARAERLLRSTQQGEAVDLETYAAWVRDRPGHLPTDPEQDLRLAELAITVAARRHARPLTPGSPGRGLSEVSLVVGSGGVFRHATPAARGRLFVPLLGDHAGRWRVPRRARAAVDVRSVLFAAGLLAESFPSAAARLAADGLVAVQP